MQAAEEALTKKQAEPIVAAAVALAAVVSVESPFIHVATIQVLITGCTWPSPGICWGAG